MIRTQSLIAALAITLVMQATPAFAGKQNVCKRTTQKLFEACRFETAEDKRIASALCLNTVDDLEREQCKKEVRESYSEGRAECREQRIARGELCQIAGFEGPIDPEIDPANFVAVIDNPYAPFAVGSRWVYEKDGEDGLETIVVEILPETREILGVECTVLRDTVWIDGVLLEDTRDWIAQDVDGNVWYFGEIAINYEDGEISDLDGSWEAGVDGARPGFWMPATHAVGDFYRQEWLPDEAEDMAEVVSIDSAEPVPFANGGPVLETRDFTPIEPGVNEFKFYVPGVGFVLEIEPESGERLELLEYTP